MQESRDILKVWKKFDHFPMETLTKAWFIRHSKSPKQRTVAEMRMHQKKFGASGNCFDLAIWLMDELKRANVKAYFIGNDLGTKKAHVAVIALDKEEKRYLCDLGDSWIKPVCLDNTILFEEGYFSGAKISLQLKGKVAQIEFQRTNGKKSNQLYELFPIPEIEFIAAGDISQATLSKPLIEMRIYGKSETRLWEFNQFESYISSMEGLLKEEKLNSYQEWADRINKYTHMNSKYVLECLKIIEENKGK